jgi:VanZ family protein
MIEQQRPQRLLRDTALVHWLPVIAWMALIFTLSAQSRVPQLPQSTLDVLLKKAGHFTEYAILATLIWRALDWRRHAWIWAWLLAVLYAGTDELHQRFVTNRHSNIWDVVIDGCGAATALVVVWLITRHRYGA